MPNRNFAFLSILLGLCFLVGGCVSMDKVLKPGQHLLYSQKIKGNKNISSSEFEPFFRQKANRKLLNLPIFPYLQLYRSGLQTYSQQKVEDEIAKVRDKYNEKILAAGNDSAKVAKLEKKHEKKLNRLNRQLIEGNWLMRQGEPPVAFDSALTKNTAEQMEEYLKSKGYFQGTVTYEYKLDTSRRARIVYTVTEKERSRIRKINWVTDNFKIDTLIQKNRRQSLLRPGDGYDLEIIQQERDRLDKLLKNNGYYDFSKQYVRVFVNDTIPDTTFIDSTRKRYLTDLQFIINNPPNGAPHQVRMVNDVYFTEDAATRGRGQRDTLTFRNIHYLARNHRFSRKVLNSKILIRPQSLYSQQRSIDTQRLLGNLDMFKYANIYYDTTGGKFNTQIYASPLDKYSYSVEAGGTVTLANGYPGPFGSGIFKIRNVFGGLEVFEFRATGGVEGVAGFISENSRILSSQQISLTSSLTFPQLLIPGRLKYYFSPFSPQTRVSLGYNFTGRPDFQRFGFKGSLAYVWQPEPEKQFTITALELSRIYSNYRKNEAGRALQYQIDTVLRSQGSTLWRAFQKAFVSSISGSYTYNNNILNQRKKAQYLRLFAESGGSFLHLPVKDVLGIVNSDSTSDGLQFYRFFKLNVDYRYFVPVGRQSVWAFRINVGYANPYGPAGTLPYEKFFFSGGPNSVRAWFPRRLGLGSSPDSINAKGNYVYVFEQPGDIILEGSAEYRTQLIKFSSFNIQTAFFVDAGNVWLLRKDKSAPNGEFAFDRFYREIALGTGVGLRFDFSFLIVRFDYGTKVYDPGRRPADRWAIKNVFGPRSVFAPGQSSLNFGIGYPF